MLNDNILVIVIIVRIMALWCSSAVAPTFNLLSLLCEMEYYMYCHMQETNSTEYTHVCVCVCILFGTAEK